MVTITDASPDPDPAPRTRRERWTGLAGAAALVIALVGLTQFGREEGDERPTHLEALLPIPEGLPPGWWSLEMRDGSARLMAPTGTEEFIGEVVRLDSDELELGAVTDCGGGGLYEIVRDGDALRFEPIGSDGCSPRQVVLTAGPWRTYTPPPRTTRVPELRSADVLATIPVEGQAARLAVVSGSVWVATVASRHLYRIDRAANSVTDRVDIGYADEIPGLAAGEGALWVSNWRRNTISRVDAAAGKVTAIVDVGLNPPGGILVGDGEVWVANAHDGTVTRIDARAATVTDTIQVGEAGDGGPQDVVAFDGRVLVSVPRQSAIVGVDPRTGAVSRFFTGRMQSRLEVTDTAVWTFEGLDATWVTRIGADGVADLRVGLGKGRHPRALTTAGETVWVLTVGPETPTVDLQLVRIDARTGQVTRREEIRHLAGRLDIVVDEVGDVWITAGDAVLRVDGSPESE